MARGEEEPFDTGLPDPAAIGAASSPMAENAGADAAAIAEVIPPARFGHDAASKARRVAARTI